MAEDALAAGAPEHVRRRIALALDVDDLVQASRLARAVRPWVGVAKVGLELFSAEGPQSVAAMADMGFEVFCDLKMYDIPTTVERASRVIGSLGVRYATVHAHGGPAVMRAAVDGLAAGAASAGMSPPAAIAVTVLTTDSTAPPHIVPNRVARAVEAGCQGVVCAGEDIRLVKRIAPRLLAVVPGIREERDAEDDQARIAAPRHAILLGADLLVVGRPISRSPDPAAAARRIALQVADALVERGAPVAGGEAAPRA